MTSSPDHTPGFTVGQVIADKGPFAPPRLPTTTPPHAEVTAQRHLDARSPQTIVIALSSIIWTLSRFTVGITDRGCWGHFFYGRNKHVVSTTQPPCKTISMLLTLLCKSTTAKLCSVSKNNFWTLNARASHLYGVMSSFPRMETFKRNPWILEAQSFQSLPYRPSERRGKILLEITLQNIRILLRGNGP